MIGKAKSNKPAVVTSGPLLVSNFMSAMTNLATAQTAVYTAELTEQAAMRTLRSAGTHANPVFVTPGDIAPEAQSELARTSLNAHLQKAQSEQINAFTAQQIAEMEAEAKLNYIGRKVSVLVIDPEFKPVESYWWDKNRGDFRQGTIKAKNLKGSIEDLSLTKNLLVIKPTFKSRLILPDRKFFFVYVVNPQTLKPAIELNLI